MVDAPPEIPSAVIDVQASEMPGPVGDLPTAPDPAVAAPALPVEAASPDVEPPAPPGATLFLDLIDGAQVSVIEATSLFGAETWLLVFEGDNQDASRGALIAEGSVIGLIHGPSVLSLLARLATGATISNGNLSVSSQNGLLTVTAPPGVRFTVSV